MPERERKIIIKRFYFAIQDYPINNILYETYMKSFICPCRLNNNVHR